MENFTPRIRAKIEKHVSDLFNEAVANQSIYTNNLNSAAGMRKVLTRGYFPRIRSARTFGFYIYWDKYRIEKGKTLLSSSSGGKYRISESVHKNKSEPVYPQSAFSPDRTPDWELAIILEAEYHFSSIRREVNFWMKMMPKLIRAPVCS